MAEPWKEERELAEKRRKSISEHADEGPDSDSAIGGAADGRDQAPEEVLNDDTRAPGDPWMGGG